MHILRSEEEIAEVENAAVETRHESRWPGQSYEDGVIATLEWLRGDTEENPMED